MSFNFSVTEQQRRKKKKITFPTKKFQKGTGEPGSSYKSRAAEASKSFPSLSPTALSRDVLPSNVSSPSEMSSSSEQMLRMFTSISVTARGTDTRRSGRAPRGVWRMREGFQGCLSLSSGSLRTFLGTDDTRRVLCQGGGRGPGTSQRNQTWARRCQRSCRTA